MVMKTGNFVLIVNLKMKMMRRSLPLTRLEIKKINRQRGKTGQSLLRRDRYKTQIRATHLTCHPVKATSNKSPSFEWTPGKILDTMVCKVLAMSGHGC